MIITQITPQKLHQTLSDGSSFLLDKDICLQNSLMTDMELTTEEIKNLKFDSQYQRARSRALWYLDRMDYTEAKLYEKLILKGFDKKASAAAIKRLKENGLVDDRRYAERLAERLLESRVSKREALQKLLYRKVPINIAKEVLEGFSVDEEEQILELLKTKYASKLELENGYQKVYAALIRKGFSYSSVKSAFKTYNDNLDFSEE